MLFRRRALGDFQEMLAEICTDPAMLVWLDGNYSTKDAPNENFARESMELFSIGIGNYTQRDVREAARAFTGWYIDDHYRRRYEPSYHDGGIKTYLGQTGRWTASDIARILANHPACGRFLARKLWTFFAYEQPETAIVEELAAIYRQSGRSMREVVRRLFSMPQFYSDRAIGGRVKSPVEHVVIAVREFGAQVARSDLNDVLWAMGQYLFYPPNVGGWPAGVRWVNTSTAVARFNFAEWLLERQSDPSKNRVDLGRLLSRYGTGDWPGTLALLASYHLAAQPSDMTMQALSGLCGGPAQGDDAQATLESILHLLMVAPEYYCA